MNRWNYLLLAGGLLPGLLSNQAFAGDVMGYVGAEVLEFFENPLYPEQAERSASLSGQLEFYHDYDSGDQRLAATLFGRADMQDDERTHVDIRELYWWKAFEPFEVYAGVRKVFWGVTESAHLVDIVNQDDLLEDIDREEKLGQPMLQFVKANDWGIWEFFTLVGFREQAFPGVEGRLRPALPVRDEAIYESDAGDQHIDYALRWSHYFGPLDIGISHFSGTARDPVFLPEYDGGVPVALVPYYSQMNRTGLSAQATLDAWLLKLEATSTEEKYSRRSNAAVTGFEYTLFGIAGSGTDLGLVVEYQYDDERGPRDVIAQNDGVLGLRWVLNDLDGTEVLFLAAHDFDYNHEFFSLELGRRLSQNWKLELEAVALTEGDPGAPDSAFRQDDYLKLEVKRYF